MASVGASVRHYPSLPLQVAARRKASLQGFAPGWRGMALDPRARFPGRGRVIPLASSLPAPGPVGQWFHSRPCRGGPCTLPFLLLVGCGGLDGWPAGRPVPPEHTESLRKLPVPASRTPLTAVRLLLWYNAIAIAVPSPAVRWRSEAMRFFIAPPSPLFLSHTPRCTSTK